MMTDLMLMAVACDQTRVFNMFYASAFSATTKPGYDKPHHTATHEEAVDDELQCQPNVSWYTRRAMEEWAYYVGALASFREGDGSLLDNAFIYSTTDQSFAKIHGIEGIPMFSAGTAGGQIKTGLHLDGGGSPDELTNRQRIECISANHIGSIHRYKQDFFKLRNVTLTVPLDFLTRSVGSSTLIVTAQNFGRWINSDLRMFDPEMFDNGPSRNRGGVDNQNHGLPPAYSPRASVLLVSHSI